MTIQSIEQVLDRAIALFIYGSSAWLSYSLVAFVVTRPKVPIEAKRPAELSPEKADATGSISIEVTAKTAATSATMKTMVCASVDWKKWKVSDLRQSSITAVCGVRTSPIGSSRKLKKADLIAQYKQNLKRMTSEPPALDTQSEKTA